MRPTTRAGAVDWPSVWGGLGFAATGSAVRMPSPKSGGFPPGSLSRHALSVAPAWMPHSFRRHRPRRSDRFRRFRIPRRIGRGMSRDGPPAAGPAISGMQRWPQVGGNQRCESEMCRGRSGSLVGRSPRLTWSVSAGRACRHWPNCSWGWAGTSVDRTGVLPKRRPGLWKLVA